MLIWNITYRGGMGMSIELSQEIKDAIKDPASIKVVASKDLSLIHI